MRSRYCCQLAMLTAVDRAFGEMFTQLTPAGQLLLAYLYRQSRDGCPSIAHSQLAWAACKNHEELLEEGWEEIQDLDLPLKRCGDHLYLKRFWDLETTVIEQLTRVANALVVVHGSPAAAKLEEASKHISGKAVALGLGNIGKLQKLPFDRVIHISTNHCLADADTILIDECEAIDLPRFASLLGQVPAKSSLILVGDQAIPSLFSHIASQGIKVDGLWPLADFASDLLVNPFPSNIINSLGEERSLYNSLWHKCDGDTSIISSKKYGPYSTDAINSFLLQRFWSEGALQFPIIITADSNLMNCVKGERGILTIDEPRKNLFPLQIEDRILLSGNRKLSPLEIEAWEWGYCSLLPFAQRASKAIVIVAEGSNWNRNTLYRAIAKGTKTAEVWIDCWEEVRPSPLFSSRLTDTYPWQPN